MKKGTLFLHLVIVILCWKASEGGNPKEQGTDTGKAIIYPSKLSNGPKSPSTKLTITQQPQDATVNPGEDVELECIFSAKPKSCNWRKGTTLFVPDGEHIQYTGIALNGECSILINHVTLEDNGMYQCISPASGIELSVRSRTAQVTILYAPKFPIIEFEGNEIPNGESIHVAEGTTFIEVRCTIADGSPAADVEWISDGISLGSGDPEFPQNDPDNPHLWTRSSVLNFTIENTNISRTNLSCRSLHPTSEETLYNETHAVIVTPAAVSTVQVFQNHTAGPLLFAWPGEYVTLHCSTDGEPQPEVWWQKWVDEFWVNFTSSIETNDTNSEYLTFEAEAGKFACVAKNEYNIYDNGIRSEPFVIEIIDEGLTTGQIIGIVFGSVAFVIIIVIIVIICYKKKKLCFKNKVASRKPNSSYGNNPTATGPRINDVRISAPVTNHTGNTANSSNSSPGSSRSQQAKAAVYATVHPKNQTRTNQSHIPERSTHEAPYLKTLEAHYSDMESLSSHKNAIPAKLMKSPSLTSSSSSETSHSSSSLSGTSRPASIANLGKSRPTAMKMGTSRPTTMMNLGASRPTSTANLATSRPITAPISIIGRHTPTGSTHTMNYIDLDLPETPIEYSLNNGEKIQYAIVKQQSDV